MHNSCMLSLLDTVLEVPMDLKVLLWHPEQIKGTSARGFLYPIHTNKAM